MGGSHGKVRHRCRHGGSRRRSRGGAAGRRADPGPRDRRPGRARRWLGPDRARHAECPAGGGPRERHPGGQHPGRRRHHRPRPVRLGQGGPGQHAADRRAGHARRHPHQRFAGDARTGDADRAAHRRVRGDRGARELRDPDPRRPPRPVQGGSPIGVVGRRLGRWHRPHAGRPDRQGGRGRCFRHQLRAVLRRRRGAGLDPGRPRHRRRERLSGVRRPDRNGRSPTARDLLGRASRGQSTSRRSRSRASTSS